MSDKPSSPPKTVMICMPSHDGKCFVETARSLLFNFIDCAKHDIHVFWMTKLGDSILPRSRNQLLQNFWDSGVDYCFFWDSDIALHQTAIRTLVESGHDFSGIAYPLKTEENKFAFKTYKEFVIRDGWGEVDGIGTGAMMISRAAVKRMRECYPGLEYYDDQTEKKIFRLFDFEVQGNMYIGEDYVFCGRWRNIGGTIHMLTDMDVAHYGNHAWTKCFYNSVAKRSLDDADSAASDKPGGTDDTPQADGSISDIGGSIGRPGDTKPDAPIVADKVQKLHAVA